MIGVGWRRGGGLLLAACVLLSLVPAPVAARPAAGPSAVPVASPADQEGRGSVVTELVHLRTEARVALDGALWVPNQPARRATGVLLIHGNPSNFHEPLLRALGEGLAEAGYLTLSLNLRRRDHVYRTSEFENGVQDVQAGVDYLQAQGVEGVYLAGHSFGGNEVAYYQATRQDPRVRALGLYATHHDLPMVTREILMGPENYARTVAEAEALVAAGRGDEYVIAPQRPGVFAAESARTFLSMRGPAAKTVVARWIGEVRQPVFMVYGDDDFSVGMFGRVGRRALMEPIYAAASGAASRVLHETAGDHFWTGHTDQPLALTLAWLGEQGLDRMVPAAAPAARPYKLELVTFVTEDRARLHGALYTPRGTKKDAAVVLSSGVGSTFYNSVSAFLGPGLAEAGYTTLAFDRRGWWSDMAFEDGVPEYRAAIDNLERLGYGRVFVHGQSLGSTYATDYVAATADPRVRGLILTGALSSLPQARRLALSDERYDELLARAEAAVAAGEGDRLQPFSFRGSPIVTTPSIWLSYHADSTRAIPRERIREVRVPLLIVHGSNDTQALLSWSQEIARNATAAPSATLVELNDPVARSPLAGHLLVGLEAEATSAIAGWLDTQSQAELRATAARR